MSATPNLCCDETKPRSIHSPDREMRVQRPTPKICSLTLFLGPPVLRSRRGLTARPPLGVPLHGHQRSAPVPPLGAGPPPLTPLQRWPVTSGVLPQAAVHLPAAGCAGQSAGPPPGHLPPALGSTLRRLGVVGSVSREQSPEGPAPSRLVHLPAPRYTSEATSETQVLRGS